MVLRKLLGFDVKTVKGKEMKAYRKDGNVILEIPEENLIFGVENSPEETMKVTDRERFLDHVTVNILDFTRQHEGEPDLNKLLDAIAIDAAEHDCGVEVVEVPF